MLPTPWIRELNSSSKAQPICVRGTHPFDCAQGRLLQSAQGWGTLSRGELIENKGWLALLDISFTGLEGGRYLHFYDVNQILIRVDVSRQVHVVSFVTLKNLLIVHLPGSLLGYEPQSLTIFPNRTHDCGQPCACFRRSLRRRIGCALRESNDGS